MTPGEYFVHNFSPYIFTVDSINFEALKGPTGIVLAVVAVALEVFFFMKKKQHAASHNGDPGWAAIAEMILVTIVVVLGAMYGLKQAGVQWGLRWYSTMYLIGFIQTYLLCRHWINKGRIMLTPIMLDSLIAYLIIGMIVGARSFYVLIYNFDSYMKHPLDALKVWEGGLSFHGGIAGVITAIVLFCRKYKIPFFHLADRLVLCVPFGIAMGRLGNFMNGELYGRVIESHIPWAVIFPEGGPQPRHPSQLYQASGEGIMLLITLILINRMRHKEGTVAAAFVFFYGFYRFFMEFFREADAQLQYYFNNTLTMGQILCILTMMAGLAVYYFLNNNVVVGSEPWKVRMKEFYAQRKAVEEV